MELTRRGFIGAIGAFASAVAAGRVVQGGSPLPPAPEQFDLMAALKECRVTSYEWTEMIDAPSRLVVGYEYAPDAPRTILDDAVDTWRTSMLPISAVATVEVQSLDVSALGSAAGRLTADRPVSRVEVEFV